MLPNLDPRALKRMMDSMGIKNSSIPADRVVIEGKDKDIVIEKPSVTLVEMRGTKTFQVVGEITEREKWKTSVSEEDIRIVKEQTGIDDDERIRRALEETKGSLADAIIRLKNEG